MALITGNSPYLAQDNLTAAYANGVEHGKRLTEAAQTSPVDVLQRLVNPGDYVIHRAKNGYIVRHVSMVGAISPMWVVEGDLAEAIKQISAIIAGEQLKENSDFPVGKYVSTQRDVLTFTEMRNIITGSPYQP